MGGYTAAQYLRLFECNNLELNLWSLKLKLMLNFALSQKRLPTPRESSAQDLIGHIIEINYTL